MSNGNSIRQWITLVEATASPIDEQPQTIEIDGVIRPVHNSEGNLIGATPEELATFWRWFGKSKIVDDSGRPLVLFHGDKPDKTEFTGRDDPSNYIQGNVFMTNHRHIAKGYSPHRGNSYIFATDMDHTHGLYSMYLNMTRPMVIDAKGESWDSIPLTGRLKKALGGWDTIQIDDLAQYVQQKTRYDGLIAKDVWDQFGDGDQYVVFSKDQIKLV